MSKKEDQKRKRREQIRAWKKLHHFRDLECCGICKYFGLDSSLTKSSIFGYCILSKKEAESPLIIIDRYSQICDGFEKEDVVAAECLAKNKMLGRAT
jgi:hypothetical protein